METDDATFLRDVTPTFRLVTSLRNVASPVYPEYVVPAGDIPLAVHCFVAHMVYVP